MENRANRKMIVDANKWMVEKLIERKSWPDVKIIFRGDSGFCRDLMWRWCERQNVIYLVGIAQNNRWDAQAKQMQKLAEEDYNKTQEKPRMFSEFSYAAKSWKHKRRVITKSEHTDKGGNPRYLVTNEKGFTPQELYETDYCGRGDMENCIKEIKHGLPSHGKYTKARIIKDTALATAPCETIRLR